MRVLVIEDDSASLLAVTAALRSAGIDCLPCESAEAGLTALSERAQGAFDAVLLGVARYGRSSWDILMEVRELADEAPVVCVLGEPPPSHDGHALELGSDDCVLKPFQAAELPERVRSALQRRHALPAIECGDLRIDLARRRVERAGEAIPLAPREYDLLLALVRAEGQVLSREDLVRSVWGSNQKAGVTALEVHLGRLRKKVDRRGRPLIEPVFGEGYRLVRRGPA
jgi:DNA-binding response OmpR family regulator